MPAYLYDIYNQKYGKHEKADDLGCFKRAEHKAVGAESFDKKALERVEDTIQQKRLSVKCTAVVNDQKDQKKEAGTRSIHRETSDVPSARLREWPRGDRSVLRVPPG